MKAIYSIIIYLLFESCLFNAYSQQTNIVVKAWAIAEVISGGAPPSTFQKAIFRKSIRFFLETRSNSNVKVIGVFIGETPFEVVEEHQNKSFPTRDYKPTDFDIKNNFIQVLVTDTLRSKNIKISTELVKQNQAVIIYSLKTKKKYYLPIKTIIHERINLP